MDLEEFLKDMEKEGGDGLLMADKIRLLDSVIGHALRQGNTILRSDGLAPFAAVFNEEDPENIQAIYLPIDTVVRQILGPVLESAVDFMGSLKERTEKGEVGPDEKVIKSAITKRPLDVLSYCEGIIDALVGASMTIMDTVDQVNRYVEAMNRKNELAIETTGNPELDKMLRASQLINGSKKPILQ